MQQEMQIVNRQESQTENLLCLVQMADISSDEVTAGIAVEGQLYLPPARGGGYKRAYIHCGTHNSRIPPRLHDGRASVPHSS